ncbi:MAG TPA: Cj0069 family protein [Chitinophagales bacterium]|nr:Cj0069 family protein [Chitinophagales bacterium]HRK28289.1 Cj0069 family protein [Chitinophagales bacterium]
MSKKIVIFEAEGGTDKWLDGHRKDTIPIANALRQLGFNVEILFYRDEWQQAIIDHVKGFSAYISRINPGNIPTGETGYFNLLRKLSEMGLMGFSHPDTMLKFGAKDVLVKLVDTGLVTPDTFAYYNPETLTAQFPLSLATGERVLKQNRGSTGEGIWRVQLAQPQNLPETGSPVPPSALLKCTEAVDNHTEYHTLEQFMQLCEKYLTGNNGMLVDMRFFPRIKEGELRVLMVADNPIFVVHKKPANTQDAFSATLFSGAAYTYYKPDEWKHLTDLLLHSLLQILYLLQEPHTPLIWTADFMLDTDERGNDRFILGEINCSCVGFTTHLQHGIQETIAAEVAKRLAAK